MLVYVITAENRITGDVIPYTRKGQRTKYLNGKAYLYYVPVFSLESKVYLDEVHCQMGITFLRERIKEPFEENGSVVWKDVWSLSYERVYKDYNEDIIETTIIGD